MLEINNVHIGSAKGKRIVSSFHGTTYIFPTRPVVLVFDKLAEMHDTSKEIVNVRCGAEYPTQEQHVYKGINIESFLSTAIDL